MKIANCRKIFLVQKEVAFRAYRIIPAGEDTELGHLEHILNVDLPFEFSKYYSHENVINYLNIIRGYSEL